MSGRLAFTALLLSVFSSPLVAAAQEHWGGSYSQAQHPYGQYSPYTPQALPGGQTPTGVDFDGLPDDRGFKYDDSPFDRAIINTFRHAYFRTEYLLWDITDPGNNVVGGRSGDGTDPTVPFAVTNPNSNEDAVVFSPSLSGFKVNDNNGIRGTFGVPLANGAAFEASVFTLRNSDNEFNVDGIRSSSTTVGGITLVTPGAFVAQYLNTGGTSQGDLIYYDTTYRSALISHLWGTEANFIWPEPSPNESLNFMPLVGFRYISFNERLNQSGTYTDIDATTNTTFNASRRIDAATWNNAYGPQAGIRAELKSKWFTIGAEPKVMLGLNSIKSTLTTRNVLSSTDPGQFLRDTQTTFSPIGSLTTYVRVPFGENFGMTVGYNLMYIGGISRPYDNTVYNRLGSANTSDFQQKIQFTDLIIQGLSVGGEFRF